MEENVQQSSEIREPMSRDISWRIEEVVDRSVDSFSDMAIRMPTVKFDEGQLMQWPNGKSTGMMICEYTLESQMFSHGPVWREAEPVFMAAESEVFTPVFTGEFVVETDPLVMAEAVTPRVSALPTVGSNFQTGLSTSVGREDRYSLGSGNILDKVDHVAGQLKVRTVPVEDLLLFSAVYFVMPSLLRSLTVQTSTFFLSDEREEVTMPLSMREDRPVKTRRLYVHGVDMRAQMTKEIHGVGPNGDRWDGIDVIDEWYMGCVSMKSQPGNRARLLRGNTCSEKFKLESGPAVRTGPSVLDLDWLDGHPNRSDCLIDNISVVSLSSDSGVHSLGEQWEYMSTYSGNSDSIQTIDTVYGDVASQADSPLVLLRNMDTRGVVFSHKEKYGKHDSMSYLSTNGHNSDIAAMSDFSDEEDEPREEVGPHEDIQPNIRTDWVGNDTIKKESNSCDHSVLHMTTTEVAPHALDPNDEDYWTKFRLLTKEAFKLDDVKLSESDYPDAVKELVFRSRLTIMEINERDDVRFEELHDSDDDGDSDLSDYYCRHKLEDYRDWHYNKSPIMDGRATDEAYKSVGNADNAEGHDLTLEMEIEAIVGGYPWSGISVWGSHSRVGTISEFLSQMSSGH